MTLLIRPVPRLLTLLTAAAVLAPQAYGHGISETSREIMTTGTTADYIWLGAEHMVTGYDHLLFLFGVLFFLRGFRDIVRFITAFTLGHCITLLGATLAGITANAFLIDAVIALSVIYKGFENLNGFEKLFNRTAPNLLAMVFVFGLIHGFGLSTRLQEITLRNDGLIANILAFNVGVEIGQVAALAVMLGVLSLGRSGSILTRVSTVANWGLMLAGLGLFAMQLDGFLHERHHEPPAPEASTATEHHEHGHGDGAHTHTQPKSETPEANQEDPHSHENEVKEPEADAPDPASDPTTPEHTHGHSATHSHGHTHTHGTKSPGQPDASATEPEARKTHTHGSGAAHSH